MWLFVSKFAFSWNKYCSVGLLHPNCYDVKFVDGVLIFNCKQVVDSWTGIFMF